MGKIKVLEVIRQGQIGGGESYMLDLISFLDQSVYEPIALAFTSGEMIERLEQMGVKSYVIPTQKPFDWHVQQRIIALLQQ